MRKRKTGRETERLIQFQVFVSSDGLRIHCFSSMHYAFFFFLQKILPTSANTQLPYPFADMFDMCVEMGSNRF